MDLGDRRDEKQVLNGRQTLSCLAINSDYAVFLAGNEVHVRRLDTGSSRRCQLPVHPLGSQVQLALALSRLALGQLAISRGRQILIYDVHLDGLRLLIPGNGRVVTVLTWCQRNADVVAAVTTDGAISVYDLRDASTPIYRVASKHSIGHRTDHIALDGDILAASHGENVWIWVLRQPRRPTRCISVGHGDVLSLSWHPTIRGRLLTASTDNIVRAWDLHETLVPLQPLLEDSDDSDDDILFGEMDGLHKKVFPIAQIWLTDSVANADWVGEHGTLVLVDSSAPVVFYSHGPDWEMLHEIWRLEMDQSPERVVVHDSLGSVSLTAVCGGHIETHLIPSAVMDSIGGHAEFAQHRDQFDKSLVIAEKLWTNGFTDYGRREKPNPAMSAHSINRIRLGAGHPITRARPSRKDVTKVEAPAPRSDLGDRPHSTSPPTQPLLSSMTSSLELPKTHEHEDESPMPFLSPSIPVRKASPNTLHDIDEILSLPPLQVGSFDSIPTTASQDSDSDDETFTGDLENSGTFMPGGVNVPLPKDCGALFGPNGQLLTFFPPKKRLNASDKHDLEIMDDSLESPRVDQISQLFPSFGNLTANLRIHNHGVLQFDSVDADGSLLVGSRRSFSMQASSLQSKHSWGAKGSPTKPPRHLNVDNIKVVVSAYNVDPVLQSRRSMAEMYHLLRDDAVSGSTVCRSNAEAAASVDLSTTAEIWHLLALLLEDKVPLEIFTDLTDKDNIGSIAQRYASIEQHGPPSETASWGKLLWADHPYGAAWVMDKVFEFAEHNGDIQLLTYASAVLVEVQHRAEHEAMTIQQRMKTQTVPYGKSHASKAPATDIGGLRSHQIPILRTDSSPSDAMFQSPTKLRNPQLPTSRTPSQPSTPYLDSAHSSPPLSFPALSRQSTSLSTGSGSASPEHHRSSFSAAAKYYAQSITDKIANYGTSPPVRKLGTSPSTNDLSSSLPTQSGSWSKSVSFASTADPFRESPLSKSHSDDEDSYDSDQTIEDNSLPQTPRSKSADISVMFSRQGDFSDEASGYAQIPLLSPDLAVKAARWQQIYADQLRCWGFDIQATELAKVASLTDPPGALPAVPRETIILSRGPTHHKAVCSICDCVVEQLAQVCPVCLHTTHPICLEQYIDVVGDEEFECPTGCGCACAGLPFEPPDAWAETEIVVRAVKKKASFTDPLLWRARIEGESW